ncbi:hypothetical protein LLG90_08275 [Aromatoleum toluclasticum]|uniref:hypothetical protein n=1 Tax=Aromatoleum toluclasticum TaxID=92003 RepID=UPI001D17E8CB|nr:hypothetical protein [Aromatoleum toluclasticum]MCC4115340.1 hypothetical protein [Aromatoleum toluclasticum]
MGRAKHKRSGRDGVRFLALPHTVMDSPAFLELSAPAVRLLLDIARQFDGKNNGRLVACMAAMKSRGWTSNDTLQYARRELEAAGLLALTRKGARPNKAAWFALTWAGLDHSSEMDEMKSPASFPRGAYIATPADAVRAEQARAQEARRQAKSKAAARRKECAEAS